MPPLQNLGEHSQPASILTPYGYQCSSCGYCKDSQSSSYYAASRSLAPAHYEYLMNHSWRRSGTTLYFPDNRRSCCPHYAIRLPAQAYQAKRDQRQALHKWNRFVLGDECERHLQRTKKPLTKEARSKENNTFDLVSTVHRSESWSLPVACKPKHGFAVDLETDDFSEEKFELFSKYQQHIHREASNEISQRGFRNFLCGSPITRSEIAGKRLGSYHQTYRLDGKLIAFAVLDLLPKAVSAVYFVYDPHYEPFGMGKISAMREAALALEYDYEYYYMGFYIHSCTKMRYKATFKPQSVLDLGNYEWVLMDEKIQGLMSEKKFVVPSQDCDTNGEVTQLSNGKEVTCGTALEAEESGLPVSKLGIPGVRRLADVIDAADLDACRFMIPTPSGTPHVLPMNMLKSWTTDAVDTTSTLKGIVAELACVIGPEIMHEIVIDFA